MPRAKTAETSAEPKRRSRNGCHNCKARKIKCNEEKPKCSNCAKLGEECDYSIRLQWGGRSKKDQDAFSALGASSFTSGFVNFTPSASPSAAATPAVPGPSVPTSSLGVLHTASRDGSNRENDDALDPQFTSAGEISRLGSISSLAANPSAYPDVPSSYMSRPLLPLPHNFQSVGSPTDHGFRSPNIARSQGSYDFSWSNQDRSKRVRLDSAESPQPSLPPIFARPEIPGSLAGQTPQCDQPSPGSATYMPYSSARTSLTPGSSVTYDPSGVRRLSVNSLLSGPPGNSESRKPYSNRYRGFSRIEPDGSTLYGYDTGLPDLDLPKNNDRDAISLRIPAAAVQSPSEVFGVTYQAKGPAFEEGGYYAQPVPIKIPKELEPLPSYLLESPMGLIYLHHFINHTARILVPHDCPDNPLRTTLPQIAVRNPNLLNILLAYSASHRARLLCHAEPVNRIAMWLRDVFPDLRRALSSEESVSNATLATAMMLASREIINPNGIDTHIPWQDHLQIARQLIISRGGLKDMGDSGDPFVNFLARWFAYLDVIGSLSGHRNEAPLSEAYWSFCADKPDDNGFAIDCFFGFTYCCISLLARVARLAHECDAQRIDSQGNVDVHWQASQEISEAAESLKVELSDSRRHVHRGCRHNNRDEEEGGEESGLELQEMMSVNEAFHLAGLIHLNRRVLGRASGDEEIQQSVKFVLQALQGVRRGGSAESCVLFPMFTAGCEAQDTEDRETIVERLKSVEGSGMPHVRKARQLMQKAWETGRPWETLVTGEFFG